MSSLERLDRSFVCKVCAQPRSATHLYNIEVEVCGECCRRLGNMWYKAHSGESHEDFDPEGRAAERRLYPPRYKKRSISPGLRMRVFERDGFKCKNCGEQKNLRCDHVQPESKGGATELANLQTLCEPCNTRKGARV